MATGLSSRVGCRLGMTGGGRESKSVKVSRCHCFINEY